MAMRGRDLREWRKRNGFSQEELRQELKLASRQTLNSWEHPEKEVPPLVEHALCKLELGRPKIPRQQGAVHTWLQAGYPATSPARLHTNQAGRLLLEEVQHLTPSQLMARDHGTHRVNAVDLKNVLRKINTNTLDEIGRASCRERV